MRNGIVAGIAAGVAAAMAAACAWQAPHIPGAAIAAPADFPERHYREVAARGEPVFRVDPASSLVVVEVRRGGSFAHLGHDHVVASHDVQGYVAPGEGRADLYVRLDRLAVDEPELRAAAELDTRPSAGDVAGTRRNMLNVLQAARYPYAVVRVGRGDGNGGDAGANVAITLHGTTRTTPVALQIDAGADEIRVAGRMSLRQTDFGIEPLSVLGGAIQVLDRLDLHFTVRAHRVIR